MNINNITLSVPFIDLRQTKESEIAVRRMRPLISGKVLSINGRSSFHDGKSDKPTIGTI
jgi:hypothetical protein